MAKYFIFNIALAIWIYLDARVRKSNWIPYVIGSVFLGVFVFPFYMAKRNLLPGEVREGGFGWNVVKNFLLIWTLGIASIAFLTMAKVGEKGDISGAQALGVGLGLGFLGMIWFFPFVGGLILGLMLKKSSVVENGPEPSAEETVKTPFYLNKWFGSIMFFLFATAFLNNLEEDAAREAISKSNSQNQEESSNVQNNYYRIGEELEFGKIAVTLEKAELKSSVITGNRFADKKKEEGSQYLILSIKYKNITNQTVKLIDKGFVYVLVNNEVYKYDKPETILKDGWYFLARELPPMITFKTKLVFKIPDEKNIQILWAPFDSYPNDLYVIQ